MPSDMRSRISTLASLLAFLRGGLPLVIGILAIGALLEWNDGWGWRSIMIVAGALLAVALCEVLLGLGSVLIKIESSAFRINDALLDIRDQTQQHGRFLQTIAEHTRLSEVARSIAYREQERELIRRAFGETLIGGDYEGAFFLADLLEKRHGYKQEADRLRQEIEASRHDAQGRYIDDCVRRVEGMLESREWDRARAEIERLLKMYPTTERIRRLPDALRQKRSDNKRRLLKEWDESVQRNDIDRGIALLKELDQYLTPNEAAALEESARGVFRAKLHNLGVQFSLAVHDKQWAEALETGQQIIAEFPNSRMAAEVREHLDSLKARASAAGQRIEAGADA
ncbi:MAG: hypothetical protein L6Q92_05360 [Phycisphaerae bacterium]|nr:hypothetical protein [Phycisphaerae bacterium]